MDQLKARARRAARRLGRSGVPRRVGRALVSCMLVLSQLLGALVCAPRVALAATSGTITEYRSNGYGDGLVGGHFWKLDGAVAYCASSYLDNPHLGATLTKYEGNSNIPMLDYVLYHGYDGVTVKNLGNLSEAQSRLATQHAVWEAVGSARPDILAWPRRSGQTGIYHGNYGYEVRMPGLRQKYPAIAAEVDKLLTAARRYAAAGGGGPEAGFAQIYLNPGYTNDGVWYQHMVTSKPKSGWIDLQKVSADPSATDGNANYALAGAEYGVYSDSACTKLVQTLATDTKGYAKSAALAGGTYYVRETKASTGYALDESTYTVVVTPNQTARVNGSTVGEQPLFGWVELLKSSANPQITDGNSCYTLAGARYGIYSDESCETLVAEIVTDADGHARSDGLAAGSYWVKEIAAPKGYVADVEVHGATVKVEETTTLSVVEQPGNDPSDARVQKVDAEGTRISGDAAKDPQGASTLAGAEFTVRFYAGEYETLAELPSRAVRTWVYTTDEDGYFNLRGDTPTGDERFTNTTGGITFPLGTYTVTETKAPAGYRLSDPTSHLAHVAFDASAPSGARWEQVDGWGGVNFDEDVQGRAIADQVKRGGISVTKVDSELEALSLEGPQGDASLAGIAFDIIPEDGPVYLGGKRYEVGEPISELRLVTDEAGKASTGTEAVPVGTYTVREAETNDSYLNTSFEQRVTVTEGDDKALVYSDTYPDEVVRGGVRIGKVDAETGLFEPQAAATLEGATFTITNDSEHQVLVDGVVYQPGEVVATLVTDAGGLAETAADALPYGTYTVREASPSEGYLLNEGWYRTFSVHEDGTLVDLAFDSKACPEQVVRGDLALVKVAEGTMARLAGIPFVITSQTTGESHVVVTDVNGQASTAAGWAAHTSLTNYNDPFVTKGASGDYELVEGAELSDLAGVWFGGSAERPSAADDALAALPYDTYAIDEVRCEANAGLQLVHLTVRVYRDSQTIDLGTIDDQPEIAIATTLTDHTGAHMASPEKTLHLYDEVRYDNLTELRGATYVMQGELHLVNADGTDGGVVATASTEFAPKAPSGTVTVEFVLDASELAGRSVVAFEDLMLKGRVVASHADLADEGQTVELPKIRTTLTDAEGWHESEATGTVTLTDTVAYAGLEPGRAYELTGTLMDKATGEPVVGADGREITSRTSFVPAEPSGTAEVTFTFAGALVRGRTVVAFETLCRDGLEYAAHADIDDEAQTVYFPAIGTTATNGADGSKELVALKGQVVTDLVAYENLEAGQSYTMSGTLVARVGGEAVTVAEATRDFVPEAASGEVSLDFPVDATALAGADLVAFEELSREGHVVATHADIDDQGQTVHVPAIQTTLTDAASATDVALADREVTLTDTIAYENLTVSKTYTARGTLMDKATGEPVTDKAGKAIVAEATFVAEAAAGTVDVAFTFDGSALAGHTVVAFESLERDGRQVAVHADIDDEAQSVHIPAIGTTATGEGGLDEVHATVATQVTDTIAYENLQPGRDYLAIGTLHLVGLDEDGNAIDRGELTDSEGYPVTARTTFTPEEASGTIDVTFTFDARELAGESVVAFEEVRASGVAVATHADITDKGQTVHFPKVHTTATDAETGTHEVAPTAKVTIVDEVAYEGLTPGNTYHVIGELMDAGDGRPITDADGNPIVAEASFKPEEATGTIDVTFTFDATALAGKSAVAFETLTRDDVVVATHADITDEAQTVSFPQIHTNAYNGADGSKSLDAKADVKVTDVVTYQGLTPGVEYVLTGTLMDKQSGSPVRQGGRDLTSTLKFTPKASNGTEAVSFTLDATKLAGHDLVVYEVLTRTVEGKEVVVAKHEDLKDADQTVKVAPTPTTPQTPTTPGRPVESLAQTGGGIAAIACAAAGAAAIAVACRVMARKGDKEEPEEEAVGEDLR